MFCLLKPGNTYKLNRSGELVTISATICNVVLFVNAANKESALKISEFLSLYTYNI